MSYFFSDAPAEIAFKPVSNAPVCTETTNLESTMAAVQPDMAAKLEAKIQFLTDYIQSDAASWEAMMEANGVRGIRKYEEGKLIGIIRSEISMPIHILDIFEFLNNTKNAPTLDPMVSSVEILKRYSPHSWMGCVNIHGVSGGVYDGVVLLCNVM